MKILITNLHSSQNLGDYAIVLRTIHYLKTKYPSGRITLMANYPNTWERLDLPCVESLFGIYINHNNIFIRIHFLLLLLFVLLFNYVPKIAGSHNSKKLARTIDEITKSDLIISTGGGNFYTNSKIGVGFLLNCLTLFLAGREKIPVIMFPQSFGPLKTRWQELLLKNALSKTKKIFVRENISLNFLLKIGIIKENIVQIPDLALSFPPTTFKKINPRNFDIKVVGFSIIDRGAQDPSFLNQEKYETTLTCFMEKLLLREPSCSMVLLIQSHGPTEDQNDFVVSERIKTKLHKYGDRVKISNDIYDPVIYSEVINSLDLIISTRLHTSIFGLINRVPTIMIGYQYKTEGIAQLLDMADYFIPIESVDVDTLDVLVQMINKEYHLLSFKIEQRVSALVEEIEGGLLSNL